MTDANNFQDWLYGIEAGGSEKRPWHVLNFAKGLQTSDSAVFWKVVTEEWSGFDLIPHDLFEEQFARFSASAPGIRGSEPLRLFRGQDVTAPIGLAWSSCADVAASFARGHRGMLNKRPIIFEILANPCDVAFQCDDRGESEFVLFSRPTILQDARALT